MVNKMKTSKQIVGLPIVSINDGKEIGTVKTLVVNPQEGTIDFLTINHEDWQISVKAIPFKKVIGVGDFAVTIENEMNVIDLTEIPIANSLVSKNIKISGARVMSKKGHLIGKVTEYYINDDNGLIIAVNVALNGDAEAVLAAEHVTTYGKDILVVNEDSEKHFVSSIDKLLVGDDQEVEQEIASSAVQDSEELDEENLDLESLVERQISLLVGKRVTENIYNKEDQLIVEEGTILTRELILAVHQDSPSGMVELSMNVETM